MTERPLVSPAPVTLAVKRINEAVARDRLLRSDRKLLPDRPIDRLAPEFVSAVYALQVGFRRRDKPNREILVGDWCEKINKVARSLGCGSELVEHVAFVAAQWVGTPYTVPIPSKGVLFSLGLDEHGIGAPLVLQDTLPPPFDVARRRAGRPDRSCARLNVFHG
jgi:hypothetical protein